MSTQLRDNLSLPTTVDEMNNKEHDLDELGHILLENKNPSILL